MLVFQQQHYHHAFDLTSTSPSFTAKLNNVDVASSNLQYGTFNTNLASSGCYVETGQQQQQHHLFQQKGHFGTRSESSMADNSQQTDDKTHCNNRAGNGELVVVDSNDQTKLKHEDQKTLHRLAQNCEAARKIRLRKKAYVQQLENSRVRLAQLE
ncbi:transcription factor PERIANTHIA isoform X1 [Arachis ipaensis]|nr:transcription factor PERIANTHIA isoform X1 [Arachis ipaensis]XP_020976606.1 transcription factor PERIANTHIA isoform X1 [Arachis ipaensis]XP_020976607.1 transcription factor PERIANTHIA isoform X1 [Arachis ipaensis]XP_020976608.1 transcription factor PERIANTHIA isoform X1 [Arachis ipaensis]